MSMVLAAFTINTRSVHLAGNGTASSTVAWVSSPNGRGTVDIVQSCFLTLILCVWTAMHLNVPPYGQSEWRSWRRYLKWSFLGIFGPELIIYIAWMQNNSARAILTEMENNFDITPPRQRQATREADKLSQQVRKFPHRPVIEWSMMHSFYASSGGFYISNDSSSPEGVLPFLPTQHRRLILTSRGIGLLARCGYAPCITLAELKDKSKADWVAKSIVVMQAFWFLAQVLARVRVGMPVTLLEINTLGHVICVFLIYLLWWNKPRMVGEPTRLQGEGLMCLTAYMYMCSQISAQKKLEVTITEVANNVHKMPEISRLAYFAPQSESSSSQASFESTSQGNTEAASIYSSVSHTKSNRKEANISVKEVLEERFSNGYFAPRPNPPPSVSTDEEKSRPSLLSQAPTLIQQRRWEYASEAVRRHPHLRTTTAGKRSWLLKSLSQFSSSGTEEIRYLEPQPQQYLTEAVGNWDISSLLKSRSAKIMGMCFWTSSIVFGAVHISAWNVDFPTVIEAWMWRCAALWIATSGLIWFLINFIGMTSSRIDGFWSRAWKLNVTWYWKAILGFLCGICGLLWISARVFLVVESFISIRKLPIEAYDTPDWTMVFPHL